VIFYDGTIKPAIKRVLKGDKTMVPKATALEQLAMALQQLTAIKDLFVMAEEKLAEI
jgi:hypothetical protein